MSLTHACPTLCSKVHLSYCLKSCAKSGDCDTLHNVLFDAPNEAIAESSPPPYSATTNTKYPNLESTIKRLVPVPEVPMAAKPRQNKHFMLVLVETKPGSGLFEISNITLQDLITINLANRRVIACPEATEF